MMKCFMMKCFKYLVVLYFTFVIQPKPVYGKWYADTKPINGSLLPGKEKFESKVQRIDGVFNVLGDENANIFYVNNFFPYTGEITSLGWTTRQLGDIFVKKGMLLASELDKIRQICLNENAIDETQATEYAEILKKFIDKCIVYLEKYNLTNEVRILRKILYKGKDRTGEALLDYLYRALNDSETMKPIWNRMHTERLLIFDKYWMPNATSSGEIDFTFHNPWAPLVLISKKDMCSSCEPFMISLLLHMGTIPVNEFSGEYGKESYKILFGSFLPCGDSEKTDTSKDVPLLKVRRGKVPTQR